MIKKLKEKIRKKIRTTRLAKEAEKKIELARKIEKAKKLQKRAAKSGVRISKEEALAFVDKEERKKKRRRRIEIKDIGAIERKANALQDFLVGDLMKRKKKI